MQAQIFYAFLRGAAKQYGKVWWGTISIWNRHGEKKCSSGTMCTDSGTSLSLLRRLMYSQILYNSLAVCLEWGWTFEDATNPPFNRSLTPIGKPIRMRGWVDAREGRKTWAKGTMHLGETLCAEAEGVFIAPAAGVRAMASSA